MKAPDKMEQQIQKKTSSMHICCDQVAWLLDIFDRYLPKENLPYEYLLPPGGNW